jgi:hypothetical protein
MYFLDSGGIVDDVALETRAPTWYVSLQGPPYWAVRGGGNHERGGKQAEQRVSHLQSLLRDTLLINLKVRVQCRVLAAEPIMQLWSSKSRLNFTFTCTAFRFLCS